MIYWNNKKAIKSGRILENVKSEALEKVKEYGGKRINSKPIEILEILDDGESSAFLVFTFKSGEDIYKMVYDYGFGGKKDKPSIKKINSSLRKPIKSSLENDVSDLKNKMESMSGEDIAKGIKKTIRRNEKPMLGIKYNVLDQNGGVIGTPMSYEDACDLADDIDGEVVPVYSSRKAVKSGKMPYIDDEDIDKFEERLNKGEEVKMKGWTFRKDDTGRISVIDSDGNLLDEDFKSVASFIDWFRYWKKDSLKSSRKAIKSSNLPSEVYYMVVQGAKMYYSTDYDKVADMVQKMNSKSGPRVYGPYTEDDPEEIQELYEVGYIGNSRKAIKSSYPSIIYYIVVNGAKQYYKTKENAKEMLDFINEFNEVNGKANGVYTETDPEEIEEVFDAGLLKSSKKPVKQSHVADINYYKQLVKSVLSNRMTEDEALTQIASRNNCNKKYAETIYNNWMNKYKEQLIKSDAEIADIQKEFNVDGDLNSWAEDYMPGSGTANTKGGELVRAAQRILTEYYNNGNMIGRGYGNETANPAARYIVEKTTYDGNDEIEDMLNHVVYMTDEEYDAWCKRFEEDFANYLRDKAELFSEPNDDDMNDYKDDDDKEFFLNKFYIEDDIGNRYMFVEKDGEYVCDDIEFANEQLYSDGDVIEENDELVSEIDKTEDYGTIEKGGFMYDWETVGEVGDDGNYKEWKIVRVTVGDQMFETGDTLDLTELENYRLFDVNGNEVKEEDFLKL